MKKFYSTLASHSLRWKIKTIDEIKCAKCQPENQKGEPLFKELGIDGRIMLRRIVN
jgi:hypothetical protein